jgi:hypothetical protein
MAGASKACESFLFPTFRTRPRCTATVFRGYGKTATQAHGYDCRHRRRIGTARIVSVAHTAYWSTTCSIRGPVVALRCVPRGISIEPVRAIWPCIHAGAERRLAHALQRSAGRNAAGRRPSIRLKNLGGHGVLRQKQVWVPAAFTRRSGSSAFSVPNRAANGVYRRVIGASVTPRTR